MIRLEYKRPIDANSTIVQLFVRVLGLLWLFVMMDTAWQWASLCGEDGLAPASELADRVHGLYSPWHFFRFPSLLWFSQADGFAVALMVLGGVGSIMALTDRLATLGLTICYVVWLSLVNFGGDFFANIWDTALLEVGFLAIFVSWLRNAGVGRKLAVGAFWLLSFRIWFSMGMVKLLHSGDGGFPLDFISMFLPNQAMPAPGAWYLSGLPDWVQSGLSAFLLFVELVVPFAIIWKRTRFIAVLAFVTLSLLIQFTGNFGWFNVLCIVSTIPLLIGTGFGLRLGSWLARGERWNRYLRIDPQYQRLKGWPRKGGVAVLQFQMLLQVLLIALLFFPLGNKPLNFLNYVAYRQEVVEWEGGSGIKSTILSPLRAGSNFRIANPYGMHKRMPKHHFELVFEASKDTSGGFWHPYAFQFKPGAGNPPSWFAPVSPRFEQQIHYEAQLGGFSRHASFHHLWGDAHCWTGKLLDAMWEGKAVDRWFQADPMHGARPQALRLQVRELQFSNAEENDASGTYWRYLTHRTIDLRPFNPGNACRLIADSLLAK